MIFSSSLCILFGSIIVLFCLLIYTDKVSYCSRKIDVVVWIPLSMLALFIGLMSSCLHTVKIDYYPVEFEVAKLKNKIIISTRNKEFMFDKKEDYDKMSEAKTGFIVVERNTFGLHLSENFVTEIPQ